MANVTEITGDLFALSPENAVLVRMVPSEIPALDIALLMLVDACNTFGAWGAGIAVRFSRLYPAACQIYEEHCITHRRLVGTALLIPPQPGDSSRHWIACLFTSRNAGSLRGSRKSILAATERALEDLKTQLEQRKQGDQSPGEVWACRFNSENFGVPWDMTREVIEKVGLAMTVVEWDGGNTTSSDEESKSDAGVASKE
ncbi:putative ADP-ribose 1''-phosphate phosphatase [Xylogone sp. PMI_703]|nr:putative ADP-ribose 1''-phosphate phosphatase [Xylogone sp. PMI_703]